MGDTQVTGESGTCHAHRPRNRSPFLIGEHPFQNGLIGLIGDHGLMQFLLTFVRLRGQDMASKGVIANDFARAGLLEPLRRTFVSLELRHNFPLDNFEQERP
jgi:hypothetical protein